MNERKRKKSEQKVYADPLIVKVFYNLMDNTVNYGGNITTIRLFVEEAGNGHMIVCEDDGDGVVAEEKEKILERGFGKNTGMGLALSRKILDINRYINQGRQASLEREQGSKWSCRKECSGNQFHLLIGAPSNSVLQYNYPNFQYKYNNPRKVKHNIIISNRFPVNY
jgi:signal transduction histidine kinase